MLGEAWESTVSEEEKEPSNRKTFLENYKEKEEQQRIKRIKRNQ